MQLRSAIRTVQILTVGLLGSGLTSFATATPAVAQVCNPFGCSAPGAPPCNPFGCSAPGAGPCNPFGCPNPGAGPCTPSGCPGAPTPNSNSTPVSNPAQTSRSFQILNNTGAEFYYLYASPAGQESWSNDVLGNNTLPNGQVWNLRLNRGCQYDFQAETGDGSTMLWRGINVCSRNSITLNP